MQTAHTPPRQHSPPGTRRSFVWSLELPSAPTFGAPVFLSSQGEIRVLVRRTTRELIEATCRFLATSREFGATSTSYPGGAWGQHLCRRGRRSRGRVVRSCDTMPQRRHSLDHAAMTIVYQRTQNLSRPHSKRPLMPMSGGSRMILIERCVDLEDATYRFIGRPWPLNGSGP